MKTNVMLGGLLLAVGALVLGRRRKPGRRHHGHGGTALAGEHDRRRVLIYYVKSLSKTIIDWYDDFYDPEKGRIVTKKKDGSLLAFPYAEYKFHGLDIYLTTDSSYHNANQVLYYWTERDSRAVVLDVIETDPDGNKMGVTNNPIFIPR